MKKDHYFTFEKEIKDFSDKKILIVDDEKEIRDLLKETLTIDNFSVYEAESGVSAWSSVQKYHPDLVLMDVSMPGKLNGVDVCRKIKTEFKNDDIRVVFLTAFPLNEEQTQELGEIDHLPKPFSPIQLVNKIYDLLDDRRKV